MPWLVSGERVLVSLEVIDSARGRARGLLGRSSIDGAVMLVPAKSVHTVGLKFPIDVVYCRRLKSGATEADRLESYEVMAAVTMSRQRVGMPRLKANAVIELEAGACDRLNIQVGDELVVHHEEPAS